MLELDHIMYAVADLESGIQDIASKTGVRPAYGGAHTGRGTHNALLSLGGGQYLEIISPDPGQADVDSGLGDLSSPRVKTWAVATDDFDRLQQICDERGLTLRTQSMSRNTPAGPTLNWALAFVTGHAFGDLFPFFIDWLESPHPAATTLQGGNLTAFEVATPDPDGYRALLAAFDIGGVLVRDGDSRLHAQITGKNGKLFSL